MWHTLGAIALSSAEKMVRFTSVQAMLRRTKLYRKEPNRILRLNLCSINNETIKLNYMMVLSLYNYVDLI